jgi:hypothetical protein
MQRRLFSSRSAVIAGTVATMMTLVGAGPAFAAKGGQGGNSPGGNSSPGTNSPCTPPPLTQPFVGVSDGALYALAPGQAADNFDATGWSLSGGASLVTTQLADGQTGQVLDLPSGAQAVSPSMCVTSAYLTARAMVDDVAGSEGVQVSVSWDNGQNIGGIQQPTGVLNGGQGSWSPSNPVPVQPSSRGGQQHARFTLTAGGTTSEFQVYDFYVDPRMSS